MVLRVANRQLGVLVAEVGRVNHLDRRRDMHLRGGVVHEHGDHLVDRHRGADPHNGVVEIRARRAPANISNQHRTPRWQILGWLGRVSGGGQQPQ